MTAFETQIRQSIKFLSKELIGEKCREIYYTTVEGEPRLLEAPPFDFWVFKKLAKFVAIEAKECGTERWPCSKLLPHEKDNLLKVAEFGGLAYIVILFRKLKSIKPTDFCVGWRIEAFVNYFNQTKERSIPRKYLEERAGEFFGNIIRIPYMKIGERAGGEPKIGWDIRVLALPWEIYRRREL